MVVYPCPLHPLICSSPAGKIGILRSEESVGVIRICWKRQTFVNHTNEDINKAYPLEEEKKDRMTETDRLAWFEIRGWTGIRILTLHVKTGFTSEKAAYHKDGIDEVGAKAIQKYSGFPPIHCFEYCLEDILPETVTPNNPVHGSQDDALSNERVTTALGSSRGPLMTT
jgi:hypothetical protein